ncbi:MAG: Ig-like domain-containing protein [Limisphaerales bacterium]
MTTIAPQTTPASSPLGTAALLTLAASLHAGNFEIQIGDLVAENVPGPGAGLIAAVDETDVYTFAGVENQAVFFEELGASAAFKGWLRSEVKSPSGRNVMSSSLTDSHEGRHQLPETGAYTLTVRVGAKDPSYVGSYSFRAFAEVFANPNTADTPPEVPLTLPIAGLLCNDRHDPADEVWIELPSINSAEGGTLATTATGIQYTPKSGFTGTDHFAYRLRGKFGGEDITTVTLKVLEGADRSASILCLTKLEANAIQVLLLGTPGQTYQVEHSSDLTSWSPAGTMKANGQGIINFGYLAVPGPTEYYRFLR